MAVKILELKTFFFFVRDGNFWTDLAIAQVRFYSMEFISYWGLLIIFYAKWYFWITMIKKIFTHTWKLKNIEQKYISNVVAYNL